MGGKSEYEFKLLDPDGFEKWSTAGGRPVRSDSGDVEKGKFGQVIYQGVSESTIAMERKVLELLDTSLDIQNTTPDLIPRAMEGFKKFLDTKPKGRKLPGEMPEDKPRGVKPATVERYLVVCRRYYRFHEETKRGKPRPAAKSEKFMGPPQNTHRRGRILSEKDFNSWVEILPSQDVRVSFANWLLLAGVPVDEVTSMTFGTDVVRSASGVELCAVGQRRLLPPGQSVFDAAFVDGRQVFLSGAISNKNDGQLTTSGLRRLWGEARRAHMKEHGSPGPTMRDVKTIGDRVNLEAKDGRWEFIARTYEDTPEYK